MPFLRYRLLKAQHACVQLMPTISKHPVQVAHCSSKTTVEVHDARVQNPESRIHSPEFRIGIQQIVLPEYIDLWLEMVVIRSLISPQSVHETLALHQSGHAHVTIMR